MRHNTREAKIVVSILSIVMGLTVYRAFPSFLNDCMYFIDRKEQQVSYTYQKDVFQCKYYNEYVNDSIYIREEIAMDDYHLIAEIKKVKTGKIAIAYTSVLPQKIFIAPLNRAIGAIIVTYLVIVLVFISLVRFVLKRVIYTYKHKKGF